MRRAAFLLLIVLSVACTPGSSSSSQSTPPRPVLSATPPARYVAETAKHEGGTVTVGDWAFPQAVTPIYPQPASATSIEQALFNGLVGFDPLLQPYGDLASEVPTPDNGGVKVTAAGMDVTYPLRAGLHWSDGQPITPDDVIFTWHAESGIEGYDLITGIDSTTSGLTVHFRSVYPEYLLLFSAVLPAHRLAAIDARQLPGDAYWQKPDVVSGPFTILDAVQGDHFTLQRNPRYADGRGGQPLLARAAHLDKLIFRAYPTRSALLAAAKNGDVDLALNLSERDVPVVSAFTAPRVQLVPELSYEQLALNHDDPLFANDPALAAALALGVDRRGVLTGVLKGVAPPADSPISPQVTWLSPAPPLVLDAAAAAAKLDADGWVTGSDGIRTRSNRRLQVTLSTTTDNPQREAEVEAIAAGWKRIGVEVRIQNFTAARLFASYDGQGVLARGSYQAAVWAWVTPPDPDAEFGTLDSTRIPGPGRAAAYQDYSRCRDPALDAALAEGRASLDRTLRSKAYQRFIAAYQAARCEVPLYQRLNIAVSSKRLHNVAPNPTASGNTWNVADWWV
jgi:peptide/nickel transport system substrate-binding protein